MEETSSLPSAVPILFRVNRPYQSHKRSRYHILALPRSRYAVEFSVVVDIHAAAANITDIINSTMVICAVAEG